MQIEAALFDDVNRLLLALAYASVRIQAALLIVPLFSRQVVPGLVRNSLGVGLALPLLPGIEASLGGGLPDVVSMTVTILKEGLIGTLIGYSVAILFWAVEAVGFLIDNQRGASIASTLNPLTGNDSSPLGILFNQAFLVYFLMSGGFLVFLTLMYESYRLWPVVAFFPQLVADGLPLFAGLFENVIRLGLLLGAPAIVAMLLVEIGLALVSRFTPQLQVFFLAMPVKSAMAFLVLAIYLPTLFGYIRVEIGKLSGLLGTLAGGLR